MIGGSNDYSLTNVISQLKEFDLAISKTLEFGKTDGNTLVIVTSDHGIGGLSISGGNVKKSRVKAYFSRGGNSRSMVPAFGYVPGSELFSGKYNNTYI